MNVTSPAVNNDTSVNVAFTADKLNAAKKNRIAFHKCGIERACIFYLLKPLCNTRVFVYCTVQLFLDMGGVSDRKRSGRPCFVCIPQVINTVRSRTD